MTQDRTLDGAIDDAMNYDALHEAEKTVHKIVGGKRQPSYKDDNVVGEAITAIGFSNMQKNAESKRQLAAISNDTTLCTRLDHYLSVAESLGFKEALKMEIPKLPEDVTRPTDYFYILTTDDGLVLKFDTYNGKDVNGGDLYFNWAFKGDTPRMPVYGGGGGWRALDRTNNTIRRNSSFKYKYNSATREVEVDEWSEYLAEGGWAVKVGSYDCREFLRRKVNGLRSSGELLKTWAARPFLWFLHYNDTRCLTCGKFSNDNAYRNECICTPQVVYNHKTINVERINQALPILAKIVGSIDEMDVE